MSAESTNKSSDADASTAKAGNANEVRVRTIPEQIVEIVSDSGEGAQTAGQLFGTVCAKMGNGAWTVEIIPAEIKPPARSRAGASGIRIRLGSRKMTNMGDEADLVIAFNEQVLYGRIDQDAFREGTVLILDNKWATDPTPEIQQAYATAIDEFRERGYVVHELPIEERIVVSEIGEQWSPKVAPASTAPIAPKMTASPPPWATGIAIGKRIAMVPQLVPVTNETKPATTKTPAGIHCGGKDWVQAETALAVPISEQIPPRDQARVSLAKWA